jgi:hypothetical protein
MDLENSSKLMSWLSLSGNVASLVSLIISFAVLRQTRAIRKAFIFRGRLPEFISALTRLSASLLMNYEVKGDTSGDLKKLNAVLRNLERKVESSERKAVKQLIRQSGRMPHPMVFWRRRDNVTFTPEEVWAVYSGTEALIVTLRELKKDLKWS